VSLERNPGVHRKLQTVLKANLDSCPLKRGGTHSVKLENLTGDTFDCLFSILDVIVKSIQPMISETRRFSTKGAWPANSAGMLPHGAAQSCRGLISSWINFDSSNADDVLFLWLIVCSHGLLAELIAQRSSFVILLLARIDMVTARAVRGHLTTGAEVRRFQTLAGLFIGLLTAYQCDTDSVKRIFGDVKVELVPTLVNIAHATLTLVEARMMSDDSLITTAHKMIVLITAVFGMNSAENIMAEASRLDAETAAPELRGDAFKAAFRAISITRRKKRCDSSGCPRYGQTSDGAPAKLQRCSRCKFFTYCSRECQRAHWSVRPRPHKDIYPLFVEFQERVAPLDEARTTLTDFSDNCRANGVQLDELITLQYYATTDFAREGERHISMSISSNGCQVGGRAESSLAFGFAHSG